jgi:ADP-heptose:LPS heptosyltransferase
VGKTLSIPELAWVIKNAKAFFGIDSVSMHLAAHYDTPEVALFGSSYAKKTGPVLSVSPQIMLETKDRMGCTRACYKDQCFVDPSRSCINNIDSTDVKDAILRILQ